MTALRAADERVVPRSNMLRAEAGYARLYADVFELRPAGVATRRLRLVATEGSESLRTPR
jgi:hypothetical protein